MRELDRHPRAVEVLRRLRHSMPGDPGLGDPLSVAGTSGISTVVRVADRLFDESPRASREAGLGVLQLYQSLAERFGKGQGSSEVTLLFTDLVGFSSWALRAGDDEALRVLRAVSAAIEPPMLQRRGQVVKRLGDGVMAVFPSAQLAFDAAVAAREQLAEVATDGFTLRLRAGVHTGCPRAIGGDYLGVDVNVAARLVEKASAGEILVSEPTLAGLDAEAISSRPKKTFRFTRVKGVPDDLKVYVVEPQGR
ncbi:adenylate/guanylate cyclase domain-containing protein [Rhodococcus sp. X156]|uniref:adenylate/guanylate cyclase domain-containing protein n=1 Tax=Rhodococcus sp. X156 TaxID=2499145 RepID=UPI001F499BED|nr:adenylate/guanylate cyclase domain-containing protein [Rhodococcus sp. X156]